MGYIFQNAKIQTISDTSKFRVISQNSILISRYLLKKMAVCNSIAKKKL